MAEEGSPAVGSPLAGKTALVTGGGTGIGRAFAQALSDHGAEVVICGRRPGPLETVAAELRSLGRAVTTVRCDLTVEDDLRSLVEAAGPVDILVNNAGVEATGDFVRTPAKELEQLYRVNLLAPVLLCRQGAARHAGAWRRARRERLLRGRGGRVPRRCMLFL